VATLILLPYYSLSGAEKLAVLDDGLPRSLILVIGLKILVAYPNLWIETSSWK
jgi:hypothetical protein